MDYQVSARKFRPGVFEELIGQAPVVQTLRNAITRKQVAHAYLFSGMRGVGKTTAARILAKALNCERGPTTEPCGECASCQEIAQGSSVDVIEIDGASNTGVDDVRELRENVKFSPFRGTYRIYIIDEVHMLSNSAFNALLKTLEEPPAHAVFVFATTEAHKIPATITSRCQHFNFRRIPRREIVARLQEVTRHMDVTVEERSLGAIARASEGSMRDALSLLDQAVAFGGATITEHDVEDMLGAIPDELVSRLVDTVVRQDPAAAVELVGEVVAHGYDLRACCGAVVERMRHLMIAAVVPGVEQAEGLMDLPGEDVERLLAEAKSFSVERLQELFHLFAQTEDRLRSTTRARFVFEVAAVRAAGVSQRGAEQPPTAAAPGNVRPTRAATPTEQRAPETGASRPPSRPPARQGGAPVSSPTAATGAGAAAAPPPRGTATQPSAETQRPSAAATKAPSPTASNPAATTPSAPPPPPSARATSPTRATPPAQATPPAPATPSARATPPAQATPPATPPPPSAQATAPPPPSAQATSQTSAASTGSHQDDWRRVVDVVIERHPNVGRFLEMGVLVSVEDHQVTVGFLGKESVACSQIQKAEKRTVVEKVWREVIGADIRLRVVELTEEQGNAVTIKQMRVQEQAQDDEALLEQARAHPIVKEAMDLFGGTVVKASRVTETKED